MRSDRERLLDILEVIDRIEAHKLAPRSAFDTDELLQVLFVHHLQTIGEAASRYPLNYDDNSLKYNGDN